MRVSELIEILKWFPQDMEVESTDEQCCGCDSAAISKKDGVTVEDGKVLILGSRYAEE